VPVKLGSFHLLHLMFDDYVLYLVESLQSHERYNELMASVRGARQLSTTTSIINNNNNNSETDLQPLMCNICIQAGAKQVGH